MAKRLDEKEGDEDGNDPWTRRPQREQVSLFIAGADASLRTTQPSSLIALW